MAINPDDTDKPFVARWNALIGALLIDPSIKLIARTACDYGIRDGEGIYPGNQRLARETGYDERTVREAWHFLRAAGMACRDTRSAWTGDHRTADMYALNIPGDWRRMPMLGPHGGRFACQECGKLFNPQPCNTYVMRRSGKGEVPATDADGQRQVSWWLWKAAFCPEPRRGSQKNPGCFREWKRDGGQWGGDGAWGVYYKARNDDWPKVLTVAALADVRSGSGTQIRQHPELRSGTPGSEIRQVPEVRSAQLSIQRRKNYQSNCAAACAPARYGPTGPITSIVRYAERPDREPKTRPACPSHPRCLSDPDRLHLQLAPLLHDQRMRHPGDPAVPHRPRSQGRGRHHQRHVQGCRAERRGHVDGFLHGHRVRRERVQR